MTRHTLLLGMLTIVCPGTAFAAAPDAASDPECVGALDLSGWRLYGAHCLDELSPSREPHPPSSAEISVMNAVRPVQLALQELERTQGWSVTYEEEPPRRPWREFGLLYLYDAVSGPGPTVQGIVDMYNQGGGDSRYRATTSVGGMHHVVPVDVRDADGEWRAVSPLLDTPVTLDGQQGLEAIREVCHQLALARGVKVEVSSKVTSWNDSPVVATNEPARNVLATLAGQVPNATWHLLATDTADLYVLNLHVVCQPGEYC